MKINNTINTIVSNDLCTGCGMCTYQNSNYEMKWNDNGFLTPEQTSNYNLNLEKNIVKLCPFNLETNDDENSLSNIFIKSAPQKSTKIGSYYNTYAGHSNKYRLKSSSGGVASYITEVLLKTKEVEHVFLVAGGDTSPYEYKIISNSEDIIQGATTKYYPVTMAGVINKATELEGKIAIVGIPCFLKSVRLAQKQNRELKDKITFLVGIFCGGLKSSFFADYLAQSSGVVSNFTKPKFRIKNHKSTASDYSFGCQDSKGNEKTVRMKSLGDMWGTGLFKNNACDFCDDVTAELADISLGDAWIKPYVDDGKGTNIIITRSELAEKIINSGGDNKELSLEYLPLEQVIDSQRGGIKHRQDALSYRQKIFESKGLVTPKKKRFVKGGDINFIEKIIQKKRLKTRENSLNYWRKDKNVELFNTKLKNELFTLRVLTKINNYYKKIKN
ncbi:Coenzyme F420 hydrogenase/dehydrogenase, beta subunit C-terminal domain [Tenacibaculum finnmarkense]|uniref:Coenzyme F420 hydrogenase/dehydrogenase, beta subunit C-terminal domain n=1 Tax=Tenacibaculum finnmarkense TaxID=2781243 RepID=UPI001E2B3F46|nr:Coenzyme F420 hydrogenase/dehydrogenase, beta subunit C-terminal domain [Tenacibaculum finnmarkense]MCD8400502.1 Coenzyme F420 hydrogenase/dehydrogenase, beta subunit C-terminal domain [Tenacibaculum finnmarkense genomovar ulcerans]